MAREKSPGLKILWLWTIGTAAVLVTFVVKTRLRDMERFMNAQEDQSPHQHPSARDSIILDTQPGPDEARPQDKGV
ncbi:uncharacterized protein LOC116210062 [Punica granatum]|uniref:Uncharacterized protein n=2 Tax=Punica granatum TaxID=22663 RepID=A0A218XMW4_PUNGR|nr:uncharacterized protein LOC116210062 [Punica granatum]XP_031399725.1 uncharacterized protein LOC116210062 [Punica granatum]XP_031399726.1 uncharacterized protein LOC116210062 [Punica granatum]XP_031399727.1 uncharacterized protein LOC116210062 [Punica granatum]XP_031399728.1 uncharacterized protein LOC116210062 [Punica granatum]OWM86140.1 hypothetical protein CDL15_Pgr010964 [Punica granatum]PKI66901.1 hypothetical protein CRG98_012664 [Punica granatum]